MLVTVASSLLSNTNNFLQGRMDNTKVLDPVDLVSKLLLLLLLFIFCFLVLFSRL